MAEMQQLQQDLQSSDSDLETQQVPTQQGQRKKVAVVATLALIGMLAVGVASMRRGHITEGRPEDSTVFDSVCKSWCAKNSNDWGTKCGYSNCAGCDDCSGGSEEESDEPAAVDCDGNCAKDKTYTCQEEMTVCEDTKMTGEGPYDWTINTITPMGYESDVPCEDPKFWVEVDLGQKTSFNKIVFLRPKRSSGSPTGWCGTKIEVDGNVIYEHYDYANNEEKASDGNKMDIVTVLASDIDSADSADTWEGQKIKVYSGSNYKNSKVNWTAHFSGLEVYKV